MHCRWIDGTENLTNEHIYQIDSQEYVSDWMEFWDKLEETSL